MADGERLWHGSHEALKLLEEGRLAVRGRRLLELGCGLGLLGLSCALQGAETVLLTDYDPELLKACATWPRKRDGQLILAFEGYERIDLLQKEQEDL